MRRCARWATSDLWPLPRMGPGRGPAEPGGARLAGPACLLEACLDDAQRGVLAIRHCQLVDPACAALVRHALHDERHVAVVTPPLGPLAPAPRGMTLIEQGVAHFQASQAEGDAFGEHMCTRWWAATTRLSAPFYTQKFGSREQAKPPTRLLPQHMQGAAAGGRPFKGVPATMQYVTHDSPLTYHSPEEGVVRDVPHGGGGGTPLEVPSRLGSGSAELRAMGAPCKDRRRCGLLASRSWRAGSGAPKARAVLLLPACWSAAIQDAALPSRPPRLRRPQPTAPPFSGGFSPLADAWPLPGGAVSGGWLGCLPARLPACALRLGLGCRRARAGRQLVSLVRGLWALPAAGMEPWSFKQPRCTSAARRPGDPAPAPGTMMESKAAGRGRGASSGAAGRAW
jgi:hypothetical protein